LRQGSNRSFDVLQLDKAEQTKTKSLEVDAFVALQWDASGDLHAEIGEFLACLDVVVAGVAHHHTGRTKTGRCDRFDAAFSQQRADTAAEFELLISYLGKPISHRFAHHVAKRTQGIGWQGCVVGMPALFVGFHDLQPFLQVCSKTGASGAFDACARYRA